MGNEEVKRKSTDVDGSIAGYFYQILLAINALTNLTNDDDEVGIECGADVRVITYKSRYISIESKFHKANMSRYSIDIYKTIFNFYHDNFEDDELYFITNVDLTNDDDKKFFSTEWNDVNRLEERINFIKSCILRYCINSESKSEKQFREKYIDYRKRQSDDKNIVEKLEKDIEQGKEKYCDYAYINDKVDYCNFVNKIKFEFKNELKKESIYNIEESIKNNLRIYFKQYVEMLEDKDDAVLERIINIVIYKYLDNAKKNSDRDVNNQTIEQKAKFSVKDLKEVLIKYNDEQSCFYENELIINIKSNFLDAENEFIELINERGGEHKTRLLDIYFQLRNEFFIVSDKNKYKQLVNKYCLGTNHSNLFLGYTTIVQLLSFLTILTFYKEYSSNYSSVEVLCALDEESLNNITLAKDEKYCYKGRVNKLSNDFEKFFSSFISETYNSPKIYSVKTVIAGEFFSFNHAPCNYKDKNAKLRGKLNIAIKQSKISNNIDLGIFYKNLDYRCISCIWLNEEIEDVMENAKKFTVNKCSGGITNV